MIVKLMPTSSSMSHRHRLAASYVSTRLRGLSLDAGAESMLAVRPEAIALTKAVGLGSSIVNPATTSAAVYSRGELRPCRLG